MVQLIDKSALVAEIEKRRSKNARNKLNLAASFEDNYLLSFLDTLETKEVDLEKEINKIWNPRFNLGWDEKSLLSMNHEGFTTIAKYFYELGLKAQKGE